MPAVPRLRPLVLVALFALFLSLLSPLNAQTGPTARARIAATADFSVKGPVAGHVPAWARPANEAGALPDATSLTLDVMLTRPAASEAAFQQLLEDQQNPTSPRYHQWLTPQQIGAQYGPAQADVDTIAAWLTAAGLQVIEVTPSRMFVRVRGSAGVVAQAFSTSFRSYTLGSTTRYSINSEPLLPAAFAGVVSGINGLTEDVAEPAHHLEFHTGQLPAASNDPAPQATTGVGANYITPGDFSVIYDLAPAYAAGLRGTGQKVAIIGRSRVNDADISNYLSLVGVSASLEKVIIPPGAADPGLAGNGDQGEATLDVERVTGTAPGAEADLVISSSATGGLSTAIQYNVQTLLDPVMTISFGSCEAAVSLSSVNFYANLFSQGAAEGISTFVSSGDSGAAGCDAHGAAPPTTPQIASINYICSNGFNTCVGGTEFNDTTNYFSYWATGNSSTFVSALSYIPEGVWDDPTSNGVPWISSGGGGVSTYVTKPSFQTGTGVPADGFRDTPDMSFTASGHDGYFGCYAQIANGVSVGSCVVTNGSFGFVSFSGTSASAPSMAAVTALLNQKLAANQGNINPLLYRLAATPSNGVYHDATVASSGVATCVVTTPSLCNNSVPAATGYNNALSGYLLTPGFDLATGWGSIDVNKFLTAAASTTIATTTSLSGSSGSQVGPVTLNYTATIVSASGTSAPTGTVQFYANGVALGSPQAVIASGSTGTATLAYASSGLANGTYLITAVYSGDTTYSASNSAALTVVLQAVGTIPDTLQFSVTPNPATTTQALTVTVAVSSTGSTATPTGSVTFSQYVSGVATYLGTLTLSGGTASSTVIFPAGTYLVGASYSGDATFAASSSPQITEVITAAASTTNLTAPATATTSQTLTLLANVGSLPPLASTGSVNFYDGSTLLGTVALSKIVTASNGTASLGPIGPLSAGSHNITAAYTGDANSLTSTSAVSVINVAGTATSTLVSATPNPATTAQTVNFAATVSGLAPFATTASVGFYDGATLLGTATLTKAPAATSGTASYTTAAALAAGTHSITAVWTGDANSLTSTSPAVSLQVAAGTATALTATPNPATVLQPVTLNATVSGMAPLATAASVSFYDGPTLLGTTPLTKLATATIGTAAFTTPGPLSAGTHSLTAVWAGDANSLTSTSAAVSEVVNGVATSTTLTGPVLTPVTSTSTFAIVATVSGMAPLASTGSVNFLDGATLLGTVALTKTASATTGTASFTAGPLTAGTHALTAVWVGDANSLPSTSAVDSVIVTGVSTLTQLAATPNPATTAQTVTLTATVLGMAPFPSAASVKFMDGATLLGTVALTKTASASTGTAIFPANGLAAGTHSITAVWTGDANSLTSTSSAVSVVVQIPTSTVLTAAPNPATIQQPITLNATVSGLAPLATSASVSFYDGSTLLGTVALTKSGSATTGTAAFTTAAGLNAGTHLLTAVWAGDTNSPGSTSAAVSEVVSPPTLALSAATPSLTFVAGATTNNTDLLTVTSGNGFAGTATFSCTVSYSGGTVPYMPGCTASPSTVTLAAGGTGTTTITLSSTARTAERGSASFALNPGKAASGALFALLFGLLPLGFKRRQLRGLSLAATLLLALGLFTLSGCGSGGSSPQQAVGTTAGTYSVLVTASGTSGGATVQATQTVTVSVQ